MNFFARIDQIENETTLVDILRAEYNLPATISARVIPTGYDDFNIKLLTQHGNYLVKVFSNFRTDTECAEIVARYTTAINNKIPTPAIVPNREGGELTIIKRDTRKWRVCIFELIDGTTFETITATKSQLDQIIKIVTSIYKIDYHPAPICDEFTKNLLLEIEKLVPNFNTLPKYFAHIDPNDENVLIDRKGKIWLIDFSSANVAPRIIDIAIIAIDIAKTPAKIAYAFDRWCKIVNATPAEITAFPHLCTAYKNTKNNA